ncbi:caspase domain-containing protein [Armillaria nabsnona]|nr:caspase domain-containing protein [Armillaria nabsnona]
MSNSETRIATTEVIGDKHDTKIDRLSDRNTGTNEGMAPDTQAKAEQLSSSSPRSPSGESGGKTPQSESDDLVRPGFTGIAGESFSHNKQDALTKEQEELEAKLAKEYGMHGPDLDTDGILQETKNRAMSADSDPCYKEHYKMLHELYLIRTSLARPQKPRVEKGRATEEEIFSLARKACIRYAPKLPAGSRFWALLIGINKYDSKPLKGCVNDVELMKEYLTKDLKVPVHHVDSLCDESATHDNIINALLGFRDDERISHDDIIIIYFSGHGSNYICRNHREHAAQNLDRWLTCCPVEMICPVDRGRNISDRRFPHGKIPDIYDREMNVILKEISNTKGPRITVILDCCHSGGATKKPSDSDGDTIRVLPSLSHDVHEDMRLWRPQHASLSTLNPWVEKWRPDMSSHVIIAACQGHQCAEERWMKQSRVTNGVFTRVLVDTLRKSEFQGVELTYSQLLMALPVPPLRFQTPVVAGESKDKLLWSQGN